MKTFPKYVLIVSVMLFVGLINRSEAQLFKAEAFGGVGMSQVDGDECYGYNRFKGQFGAGVLFAITDWMDVSLEILYNSKGAYKGDSIAYSSYFAGYYDLKMNYIEAPVMVYLIDKYRYSFGLGLAYGRLVSFSEKINGTETDTRIGDGKLRWKEGHTGEDLGFIKSIDDLDNPIFYDDNGNLLIQNSNSYKKSDISFCASGRIRIWEGLHAELRYQYSIVPVRTRFYYSDPNDIVPAKIRRQYNNQISLRLTYIFGEDRTKLNRLIQEEEKARNKRN